MRCILCEQDFNDKCGSFTRHLLEIHNITRDEYVVISEHREIPPICSCGYCNETPEYYRGSFRKYSKGHNTFKWRNSKYVELHSPRCVVCGELVGFTRNVPHKLCDKCISIEGSGFSSNLVQQAVSHSIKEKYGVNNVMEIEHVKTTHMNSINKADRNYVVSDENRKKSSDNLTARWNDKVSRKELTSKITNAVRKPIERERRRQYVLSRILNEPGYLSKLIGFCKCSTTTSKLHIRVRGLLGLNSLGFESEVQVGRYVADELNELSKVIVEINGDYIHANPLIYTEDCIIRTHQGQYFAKDKWAYDSTRTKYLESIGYMVIIVWESDLLDEIKMNSHIEHIKQATNATFRN